MHPCPVQFDIVDRAIEDYSMPGETVFDPFGGIMTVPYCALLMGRKAIGVELNPDNFADGVTYTQAATAGRTGPSLFDLPSAEAQSAQAGIEAEALAPETDDLAETGAAE